MSNEIKALLNSCKLLTIENSIDCGDGQIVFSTLDVEALERAIHNLDKSFLPSHPDSEAARCGWGCDYCAVNDYAK
jgi:hypothetical protein